MLKPNTLLKKGENYYEFVVAVARKDHTTFGNGVVVTADGNDQAVLVDQNLDAILICSGRLARLGIKHKLTCATFRVDTVDLQFGDLVAFRLHAKRHCRQQAYHCQQQTNTAFHI